MCMTTVYKFPGQRQARNVLHSLSAYAEKRDIPVSIEHIRYHGSPYIVVVHDENIPITETEDISATAKVEQGELVWPDQSSGLSRVVDNLCDERDFLREAGVEWHRFVSSGVMVKL